MTPTVQTPCPLCDAPVALPANPMEGEILACEACSAELELESLQPPTLVQAPEVEEDWGE